MRLAANTLTAAALTMLCWIAAAQAVMPGEEMDDPALETRARALYQELRCVVCQNESIDSSDAEIAADLRALVRTRLLAGDSDQQVRDAVVARYGTYVLLAPPLTPETYALWYGPAALLVAGLAGILIWRKRRGIVAVSNDTEAPLSAAEQARLAKLLNDQDKGQRA